MASRKGFVKPRIDSQEARKAAAKAFNSVSGGSDSISVNQVAKLLQSLGMLQDKRTRSSDIVVALGQMKVFGDTVPKANFLSWYVANVADFGGSSLNRLLVKHQLGNARTSSYQLPGDGFTYGHVNKWDPEGAGEVALSWVAGKRSTQARGKRNIVAENKASVAIGGAPTGKALARWRKANPQYIKPPKVARASRKTNPYSSKNLTYGQASKPSEPVAEVLKPTEESTENYDANYPDMSGQAVPGKMPLPRPTHSSNLLAQRSRANKGGSRELFKMKKFTRVQSKVNSRRSRSAASKEAVPESA